MYTSYANLPKFCPKLYHGMPYTGKFWQEQKLVKLANHEQFAKFSLPIFTDITKMYLTYILTLAYSPNSSLPIAFTCMIRQNFLMYGTLYQDTVDIVLLTVIQRNPMRHDGRLYHPKVHSEITTFMDAYWRQKEQEKLQQQILYLVKMAYSKILHTYSFTIYTYNLDENFGGRGY